MGIAGILRDDSGRSWLNGIGLDFGRAMMQYKDI